MKRNLPEIIDRRLPIVPTDRTEVFKRLFKGLMKESFDEWLGDKRAKEIREEREEIARQKKWEELRRKWQTKYKAQREEERHNPTITIKMASSLLGIAPGTLRQWARKKKVIGEYNQGAGWSFKTNYIIAYKRHTKIKKGRPGRRFIHYRNKEGGYLTAEQIRKEGLLPLSVMSLLKYARLGFIKHKVIPFGKRDVYLLSVEHILQLKDEKPAWLKKSLRWHESCNGE